MRDHEFTQFIERVKLRAPIEEVVQSRVPELKRAGALWQACCPFHEEKTPSFKVDPSRGTWHCYGACGTGGDALDFTMRFDGVEFMEALEILAHAVGEPMPELRRSSGGGDRRSARLYEALARAEELYRRHLMGAAGEAARAYLEGRGLGRETVETFGLGLAPASGSPLVELARREGWPFEVLAEAGLARRSEGGREYDFFRGRLTIPIRDRRGRTVGFGARGIDAGGRGSAEGPKYVNTPETPLFKKSRLIYGFDRALEGVRKTKELILVEGYTDVMAAHQAGLLHTAAVLGTATTEDHARLVRQSQTRRVTLVFDGDEAGRQAAHKALHGLLPLQLDLRVATLPAGQDPCDLLVRDEGAAFREQLAAARDWFGFLLTGLQGLGGGELAAAVDPVLKLLNRVPNPIHQETRLVELARFLELPEASVRRQWGIVRDGERRTTRQVVGAAQHEHVPGVPAEARGTASARPGRAHPGGTPTGGVPSPVADRRERRAFEELAGACLLDNEMIPDLTDWFDRCTDEAVGEILRTIAEQYENNRETGAATAIDASAVATALGDHPARSLLVSLEENARRAESPEALARGALGFLDRFWRERSLAERLSELLETGDEASEERALQELYQEFRRVKVPSRVHESGPAAGLTEGDEAAGAVQPSQPTGG